MAIGAAASVLVAVAVIVGLTSMPRTVTVQIINEGTTPDEATFEPRTVSVQPDTDVVWKNTDASVHTVTSTEPAGVFDSGVMGPDEEFAFTFQAPGTFDYFCAIHPMMVGTVLVQ
jgi:plastocyanin